MKVYFIGAGPGDMQLLTLKAKDIISKADIVIYAGSLVNKGILKFVPKHAELYDSSAMTLRDVLKIMQRARRSKNLIARIHSGDPSLYGAIQEQMSWCEKEHITYEVIPGVSSFSAAAAALKQELTLPGISQTVIITRFSGRTKVPKGITTVIFLSIQDIDNVVKHLLSEHSDDTPAAVVSRASWPDEKIITGALRDIATKVKKANIRRQALIFVGKVLKKKNFQKSCLYDKNFSHSYRK